MPLNDETSIQLLIQINKQKRIIMDHPQMNNLQDTCLRPDKIIAMMRVTKKTDPLFKPLKKLKTALQSIGYDKISTTPTKSIILFHFGLGNDLDLQFIRQTNIPLQLTTTSPILPGKAYCYLTFKDKQEAVKYVMNNFTSILEDNHAGYCQIVHENLNRVMISLFLRQTQDNKIQEIFDIQNVSCHYQQGSIPGIKVIQNFISKQEEFQLLQNIDKGEWSKLNNRRVQHFGYEFKYGRNQIDKQENFEKPIPGYMKNLFQKLSSLEFLPGYVFDQMTINDYFAGDGIPAHFDTHSPFQEHFVAISMLSGLTMDWKKYDGTQKQVYLNPRSLIIFAGQGRYAWTHGIACRKMDRVEGELKARSRRISITLRKIKFTACTCPYYFYCDSQGYDQNSMKKKNPLLLKYMAETVVSKKLEQKSPEQIYKIYVLDAYKGFGFDFHNRAIPQVQKIIEEYIKQQQPNIWLNILDVGCGNGQYQHVIENFKSNAFFAYTGIQICKQMKEFEDKIHMDGTELAFRHQCFDLILCVAVLHHLTTEKQRLKMLSQLKRVAKADALIVITVFGFEQKINIYKDQDILLDYCLPHQKAKKVEENKEQQMKVEKRGQVYQRYYHLFKQEEIITLCEEVGLKCLKLEKDKQNIILKCRIMKQQQIN